MLVKKSSAQLKQVKDVVELLEKHAFAYESALPLELGKASLHLIDPIEKIADMDTSSLPPLFCRANGYHRWRGPKSGFCKPYTQKGEMETRYPFG